MTDRQTFLQQRLLERERAAEHEGDEIVAPVRHDVGRLLHDLSITPHAIAWQVGADVEVDAEGGNAGIADVGHTDDRARFGIELAEAMKGAGEFFRQDCKIALHEAVGDARRVMGHTGPAGVPRRDARR